MIIVFILVFLIAFMILYLEGNFMRSIVFYRMLRGIIQIPKENKMKLTPPTKNVFWISVVLAALGLVGQYVSVPFVSAYNFYFVLVGYILLFLGVTMKGF